MVLLASILTVMDMVTVMGTGTVMVVVMVVVVVGGMVMTIRLL
jgi:hypothetical protein